MLKFYKLVNGKPVPAPNALTEDDRLIINPTQEQAAKHGFYPLRYTEPPATDPGYHAVEHWEHMGTEITQKWTVEQDEPPAPKVPDRVEVLQEQVDENTLAIAELMFGGVAGE